MAFPINAKQILIHVSIFIEDEIQTGSKTSQYPIKFSAITFFLALLHLLWQKYYIFAVDTE